MKLFPKVQFILTAHSPLFVMGMEKVFGEDGFRVIDMPSGNPIDTEAFDEFGHALSAFTQTQAFDQWVLAHIQRAAKPVVVVEGKFDVTHLQAAWEKLYNERPLPWDIVPCGGFSTKEGRGGAEMLRTMLRACCLHLERTALGLFDYDREGVEQFESLKSDGFEEATERTHWKHSKQPVHSLLLPVPPGREKFVSTKAKSCFLAIEHYYSDAVLNRFGVADDPVVADSVVFGITSDSRKKLRFAEGLSALDRSDFTNFAVLFDRLTRLLGGDTEQALNPLLPANQIPHQITCLGPFTLQTPTEVSDSSIMMSTDSLDSANSAVWSEVVKPNPGGETEIAGEKKE
jgi:hypothetical protein